MKKLLFVLFIIFVLTACEKKVEATKVTSSVKTVNDIMAEADKNHGGTITSKEDKNNPKNKVKLKEPVINSSNINIQSSNMKRSNENNSGNNNLKASDINIDLTKLSSTMVYSEVYNMMNSPEDYIGKMVRMNGTLAVYKYPERNYYTCIIKDATACCQQGLEFVWKGNHSFPDDYPKEGSNIIVTGIFDTYYEGEQKYCQLKDASLVKGRA